MDIEQSIDDVFRQHANRPAVRDAVLTLTYAELDRRSHALALQLLRCVPAGGKVLLALDRSVYSLLAIVAAIRAGVCYVPVEWDAAAAESFERLHGLRHTVFMAVGDIAEVLAAPGRVVIRLDEGEEADPSPAPALPAPAGADLIYTIYTSGSTGIAKGVNIRRDNVWHYTSELAALLGIDRPLQYAYVSSLSADLGNTCLFLSLLTGGTLHLLDDQVRRDARGFQRYMAAQRIDVLKISPSHFAGLTSHRHADFRLQWLVFGGESLASEKVREVFRQGWAASVANHYGPTETTIGAACYPMRDVGQVPADGPVPVGFPIGRNRFELVDAQGRIITEEPGAEGELMIGGAGVGAGYANDPALSARAFAPLPGLASAGVFYASGDLFRRSAAAYVFVGRKDRQLKLRGYRVDPDAIESLLVEQCDAVAASVLVHEPVPGGPRQLAAFVVPRDGDIASPEATHRFKQTMAQVLPAHMLPGRLLLLEELPITGNGKADHRALKAMLAAQAQSERESLEMPEVELPRLAAATAAWRRALGAGPHSAEEDFYAAGGDSILTIQLLSALQNDQWPVQASVFYRRPTFAGLLEAMRQPRREVSQVLTGARHLAPIQHWFLEHIRQGRDHWSQVLVIDAARPVDPQALRAALVRLLEAHPILSTCFDTSGEACQVVDGALAVDEVFACQDLPSGAEAFDTAASAVQQQICLRTGALLRVRLLRAQDAQDRLLLVCHHLVVDGVSWRILVDDLTRLYGAERRGEPRAVVGDPRLYWSWTERLQTLAAALPAASPPAPLGAPVVRALPTDFNMGPNVEASTAVHWISFDEATTQSLLRELPRRLGLPIQDLLLAAFARSVGGVLGLGRSGLVVDVESHGRQLFEDELDLNRAVGWFTALFPCLVELDEEATLAQTATQVQARMQSEELDGVAHGVRRYLRGEPTQAVQRAELCFNYLGHFGIDVEGELGWSWSHSYPGAARHPSSDRVHALKLTGRVTGHRLALDLSYSSHSYARQTIARIGECLAQSLVAALHLVQAEAVVNPPCTLFTEQSSTGLLTYVPAELQAPGGQPAAAAAVGPVLITGATGFIGIYLLRECLQQGAGPVHCLVRRGEGETAVRRLWRQFAWYFPATDAAPLRARVQVHEGDVTLPGFGLDAVAYERLAAEIGCVLHAAADVRLMAPLEELRATNVKGTRHVIDFCQSARAKHLHLVSTLSVAGMVPGSLVFSEDELACGQTFLTPYEQSKYEAELLVRRFVDGGGRASIYRTGSVSADAAGTFQINIDSNRVMQSLGTYVLTGLIPDRQEDLLLCRVDDLARALVRLALDPGIAGGTFHLTPVRPFMHNQLLEVLRAVGFKLDLDSNARYLQALQQVEASHPREAALGRMWAQRPARGITIDATRTDARLRRLGVEIAPVDEGWFLHFVQRCIDRGFLPSAEAVSL